MHCKDFISGAKKAESLSRGITHKRERGNERGYCLLFRLAAGFLIAWTAS